MASLKGAKRKVTELAAEEQDLSPPPTKRKIQSTTNQYQLASFFTPTSQRPPESTVWRTVNQTLLVARYEPPGTSKTPPQTQRRRIASFDLDGTLITSASGKTFSKDSTDWKWWDSSIPIELRSLHEDGHQIIIFSNQGGISLKSDSKTAKSDGKRLTDFKTKIGAILKQLDLPITVYAATERDSYRKPVDGMWREMLEDYDLDAGEGVDMEGSIFVGDAGGRSGDDDGKGKKDFASSDRDFAANIGIEFLTPKEYFLKEARQTHASSFDHAKYIKATLPPLQYEKTNVKDIVVLCGSPGIGKSTFYWTTLRPLGYERVNQDLLGSREKCLSKAAQFLKDGKSVAVDNTNADEPTRQHWLDLGKRHAVNVRCVILEGDSKIGMHNSAVRAFGGALMNPEQRAALPPIAFSSFTKRWSAPKVSGGYQDVLRVPFMFRGNDEQRRLWNKHWT